jgi:hypothetical protein
MLGREAGAATAFAANDVWRDGSALVIGSLTAVYGPNCQPDARLPAKVRNAQLDGIASIGEIESGAPRVRAGWERRTQARTPWQRNQVHHRVSANGALSAEA